MIKFYLKNILVSSKEVTEEGLFINKLAAIQKPQSRGGKCPEWGVAQGNAGHLREQPHNSGRDDIPG